MTDEPRSKYFGETLSEWIEAVPNELPRDAVGLWQIVPTARDDFGLEGEALTAVRRALTGLVRRGALPVVGGAHKGWYWLPQPQYGSDPDEIVENVLQEWIAAGMPDGDPGGLWFALPERCKPI